LRGDGSVSVRKQLTIVGLILIGTVMAYLPALDGDFQLDDFSILGDPLVTAPFGRGVAPWLTFGRPVTTFTFALNHLAVGLDPRGWHVTNLVIHLVVVVLAWAFVRATLSRAGLSRPDGPATAAAGIFALHPLQTESVAYIVQRAESLASGLYLAALLLLVYRDAETRPWVRRGQLAAAVGLHSIGLATKPILVTLPFAWLLHVAVVPVASEGGISAWRRVGRRLAAALPLLALSSAAAVSTLAGLDVSSRSGFELPGLPAALYAATQLRAIPTYLRLLAWPTGQCVDWFFPVSGGFLEPAVLGGAALLGLISASAIFASLRFREASGDGAAAVRAASFGALFFLLVLAPTSSVVPLRDPVAEHRVYLAALGVIMAVAAGISVALRRLAGARAGFAGAAVAMAVMLAAAIATAQRSTLWASQLALWSDAARKAPQKARVHLDLGYALRQANRPGDALVSFQKALELRGDHTVSGEALFEAIVSTLITVGRIDDARAEVERVLAIDPGDAAALAALANIAFMTRRDDECERAASAALAAQPRSTVAASALTSLGKLLLRRGNIAGAREALRSAAATGAINATVYAQLGIAEEASGARDAACAAYARAAGLPGNVWDSMEARNSIARLRCP